MSRFRGRFEHAIDAKNRVNIPAKFRKVLPPETHETFVIIPARNGCLRAYPEEVWARYEGELEAKPEHPEVLEVRRLIAAFQTDSLVDAQGRITLTPSLMKIAGIQKDVVMLGLGSYIEIWASERFAEKVVGPEFDQDQFDRLMQKTLEIAASPAAPKQ